MTSARLGTGTAARLPGAVRRPGYNRATLAPGILHLGVGAFHRCHQAEFTDDALEAASGDWGIIGVNLAPPDLAASLGAQDGLFCRELREGGTADRRLVGSILRVVSPGATEAALAAACDPAIRVVTLTVTEKGYCHVPATGALDLHNYLISQDIARPQAPRSAPGFVTQLLARRWARGLPPPVFIPCDNVPENGAVLARCVTGFAELVDPALAERIRREVRFLDTIVDRIVPATRDEDRARFAAETGLRDEALVVGEPFRMWVITDPGEPPLPAWDKAGAILTADVRPFETLKMRVVNGIQSNLCQLGVLDRIAFMAEVMADPVFAAHAERTIRREVLPLLPPVPGIVPETYLDLTLRRLRNPDLRHETAQISTDGSQKIRQRLVEPLRAARAAGGPWDGLALGLAGWMQHACGRDHQGRAVAVNDPLGDMTLAIGARSEGDPEARVRALLGLEQVFPAGLAADTELVERLAGLVAALQREPAREVVRGILQDTA